MEDPRIFCIPDIHGMFDNLEKIIEVITKQANFSLENGDMLIQIGDRSDRGPDSYKVNEYFKSEQIKYPKQVIVLMGNHDRMLLDAAGHRDADLMYMNGGKATEKSYSDVSKIYGRAGFGNSVQKTGHYDWLKRCPLFYETEDYFFSHAPIPLEQYRSIPVNRDFRTDEHTLTWSYVHGVPEDIWIDPNPVLKEFGNESKIAIAGHIHSGYYDKQKKDYSTPNPRRFGNSILLDTGSGCWKDALLSCLELPSLKVYMSDGSVIDLEKK